MRLIVYMFNLVFSDEEPGKIKQADMLLSKEAGFFYKAFETAVYRKEEAPLSLVGTALKPPNLN